MKKIILFMMIFLTGCQNIEIDSDRELKVLDNSDSKELTFILELNTKNNSPEDVEEFTMYLADFIVTREPSTVYGYYIWYYIIIIKLPLSKDIIIVKMEFNMALIL